MKEMIEHNRHFTKLSQESIRRIADELPAEYRRVAEDAIERLEVCARALDDMEEKWKAHQELLKVKNGQVKK